MTEALFDLKHTLAEEYLKRFEYPWQAVVGLADFIIAKGARLGARYMPIKPGVWVHCKAKISPTANICAPCIIGEGSEVRHCAYVRGAALVGEGCVIGNSTEIKNAIVFDGAQLPHFNYVGDSIIGYFAHLGAGAIISNVRADRKTVRVKCTAAGISTGLAKLGAMVGDYAEVGCNSVLNPGAVIGRRATVYPLSSVRGVVPANCIYKSTGNIVRKV